MSMKSLTYALHRGVNQTRNAMQMRAQKFRPFFLQADAFMKKHENMLLWVLCIIYKISIDALYVWATSPVYAYLGFIYTPNFWKYCASWIMYLVLFAYLPRKENQVSVYLMHFQLAYIFAPLMSYFAFADESVRYILMVFLCALLEIFIIRRPVHRGAGIHIRGIQNYLTVFGGILIASNLIIPILYNGFAGAKAFDFQYIYVMRANAEYPPLVSYVIGWAANVIVPFAILYFFDKKKYVGALVSIILQVVIYMETGQKAHLFYLGVICAVYFLAKTRHLLKLMYGGLSLLSLITIPAARMDQIQMGGAHGLGVFLNATVGGRALLSSSNNMYAYYHFFRQYPKLYFSDGRIGEMFGITNLYSVGPGNIATAVNGLDLMSSNSVTGYLGDSYAQLGFPGLLLGAVLLALLLRSLSIYGRGKHLPLVAGIFSVYIVCLKDAALQTVFFGGGMFLSFLFLFVYLSDDTKGDCNELQRL